MYRHLGDAVPPLISYQIANVVQWILTGEKPNLKSCILKGCHLRCDDLIFEGSKETKISPPPPQAALTEPLEQTDEIP